MKAVASRRINAASTIVAPPQSLPLRPQVVGELMVCNPLGDLTPNPNLPAISSFDLFRHFDRNFCAGRSMAGRSSCFLLGGSLGWGGVGCVLGRLAAPNLPVSLGWFVPSRISLVLAFMDPHWLEIRKDSL